MARKAMVEKSKRTPKFQVRQHNRCQRCGRSRAFLRRFGQIHPRRLWLRGDRTEGFSNLLDRRFGIDIADDRDDGVIWRVVGPEERRDVLD